MEILGLVIAALFVLRPRLYYTWGGGWYGSLRLPGGFRLGHRL